nr:serine protease [Rhabdothermincola salaria]
MTAPGSARADGADTPAGLSPQIAHGEPVPSADAYPWIVSPLFAEVDQPDPVLGQFCAGSLIAPGWVLTAAHCMDFLSGPEQFEIVVGQPDLELMTSADRQAVASIVIHPDWDRATGPNHDIALVQLADPSRNASVPTLALVAAGTRLELGTPARVLGWGVTETLSSPTFLRQGDVAVAAGPDSPTCRSLPTLDQPDEDGFFYLPETMVCAFGESPLGPGTWVNACGGDSGGPLVVRQGGEWALAGIASWNEVPCGWIDYPEVYTRVSSHLDWIAIHVPELFEDPDAPVDPPIPPIPPIEPIEPIEPPVQTVSSKPAEPSPALAEVTPRFTG